MDARLVLLVQNQTVENCQDLLPVTVDALQRFAERHLEIRRPEPFVKHIPGDVNILTEILDAMAAQEQSVEKSRLPLWS